LIFESCGAQLLFQIVLAPTILDFTKSRMNGAKVAKSVRIHPSDRPIVFASSYSESAAVGPVQHDRRGMLRKPLKVEKLKAFAQ
jgi:two-component SAPR family response regulator